MFFSWLLSPAVFGGPVLALGLWYWLQLSDVSAWYLLWFSSVVSQLWCGVVLAVVLRCVVLVRAFFDFLLYCIALALTVYSWVRFCLG